MVRSWLSRSHSGAREIAGLAALYGLYEVVRGAAARTSASRCATPRTSSTSSRRVGALRRARRAAGVRGASPIAPALLGLAVRAPPLRGHGGRARVDPPAASRPVPDRPHDVRRGDRARARRLRLLSRRAAAPRRARASPTRSPSSTGLNLSSDLLGALYNPFAAVPSLHFGYALIVGVALATIAAARARCGSLGALYPAAMLLIIVATGNHFFVDAALGGLVVVVGWLVALASRRRRARAPRSPAPRVATPPGPDGSRTSRGVGGHTAGHWPPARQAPFASPTRGPPCDRQSDTTAPGDTAMSPLKRSNNLAARMGRWSARHRKTAIFGWLAFVVAAVVIGGAVGTKQLGDNDTLPGESGKAARILDDGFEQPAGETVLVQSVDADGGQPRLPRGRRGRRPPRVGRRRRRQRRRARTRPGNGGQVSADGHSAIVNFDIRGDSDKAVDKIDPVIAAVDARCRRAPGALDRRVRRQRREAARREVQQGPRAGRPALAAGHDRHPRDRLRRARRRGHPAAARALGGDGDDGPARDPEPGLAGRREHQRDRAPDRAGRRRRLLDVLLEARARGARGRARARRGARGRRRHLGPLPS